MNYPSAGSGHRFRAWTPLRAALGRVAKGRVGLAALRVKASAIAHPEVGLLWAILAAGAALILLVLIMDWQPYRGGDVEAGRFLLSTLAVGLAAILALLVTLSLVATQLAAGAYTTRTTEQRLRDRWFWGAMLLYLLAILWSSTVLGASGLASYRWSLDLVGVAFIVAGMALLYLVPFTIATLKSLRPGTVARWLIRQRDYVALDELLRQAVDRNMVTLVGEALGLYTAAAVEELNRFKGDRRKAEELGQIFFGVGRHACQRRIPDALNTIFEHLAALVAYCNEYPRNWREAADVFNEIMKELYAYSEEWMGGGEP